MTVVFFTGFFQKWGRFLWNLVGKFLGCKYFYRATFESCGLEIGHLAAVFLICAMLPQAIPAPPADWGGGGGGSLYYISHFPVSCSVFILVSLVFRENKK
jgi:hypothetical protein